MGSIQMVSAMRKFVQSTTISWLQLKHVSTLKIALIFSMMLCLNVGRGQTTVYNESCYNGSGGASGNSIAIHETNNRFNEDALTYSGTGDMRTTLPSSGYLGASGTWNVFMTAGSKTFVMDGLVLSSFSSLTLAFGVRKGATAENGSGLIIEYSTTGVGGSYTPLSWGTLPTGTGTAIWHLVTGVSIPNNATTIRFSTTSTNLTEFRLDDIQIIDGAAPTTSTESDIIAVAPSEAATISSLTTGPVTDNTSGAQVWSVTIRDGGSDLTDVDTYPTIINSIVITPNGGNAVQDWSDAIQEIALFDGTTKLASGVVAASTITFSGAPLISVPDEGSKTLTLRLTLQQEHNNSGFNDDGDDFVFNLTNANVTKASSGSSSFSAFITASSTNGLNAIDVIATQLSFTAQPFDNEVNTVMTPVVVSGTDTYGNIDRDITGMVNITSTGTLSGTSTLSSAFTNGSASFSNLSHIVLQDGRTLNGSSTGFSAITSTTFNVTGPGGTQFAKGDLLILAFNNNRTNGVNGINGDEITFFTLKEITNGTVFYLTDNGYERKFAGQWGTTEGFLKFAKTSGTTIPAGKILNIGIASGSGASASDFKIYDQCGNNLTSQFTITLQGGSFNANAQDDFWFGQGGSFTNVFAPPSSSSEFHKAVYSGTILSGWTATGFQPCIGAGGGSGNMPADAWDGVDLNSTCSKGANGTQGTTLPPKMACFVVDLSSSTSIIEANRGRVKYIGPLTLADKRGWIDRFNDFNNWAGYANDADYDLGPNYVTAAACDPLPISPSGIGTPGSWQGSKSEDWFDCDNWTIREVPDANTDVIISTGTYNALVDDASIFAPLYNNIAVAKSVTMDNSMQLSLGSTVTDILNIGGNMTLNGSSRFNNGNGVLNLNNNGNLTFNATSGMNGGTGTTNIQGNFTAASTSVITPQSGTFNFTGSSTQTITNGHTNPVFNNVIVNNTSAAGVTLAGTAAVQMNGVLTLQDGLVNTSLTNLLTLTSTATCPAGGSFSSFVNGPMRKEGDADFRFPVGKPAVNRLNISGTGNVMNGGYRPISISGLTASANFLAEYQLANPYLQGPISPAATAAGLQAISRCEYWDLVRETGTQTPTVTLTWSDNAVSGQSQCNVGPYIISPASTYVVPYYNGMWGDQNTTFYGRSGTITTPASPLFLGEISWDGAAVIIDSYLKFVIGTNNWQQAPLPFDIKNFKATGKGKIVQLDWLINHNDEVRSYVIERSRDGIHFENMKMVAARANEDLAAYADVDPAPYNGWGYYRLRITDFVGKIGYSAVQKVWMGNTGTYVQVTPKPAKDRLWINLAEPEKISEMVIVNSVGQLLFKQNRFTNNNQIDISSFRPGVYYVRIVGQNGIVTEPFVKE